LDIDELAIRTAIAVSQAEEIASSLVAAKNAKEIVFNFAPSRERRS